MRTAACLGARARARACVSSINKHLNGANGVRIRAAPLNGSEWYAHLFSGWIV